MEKKVLIALVVLVNMVYVCQAQNAVVKMFPENGATNVTPVPYLYRTQHVTNRNTKAGTPSGINAWDTDQYQLDIIGGFSDGFHFYPIIPHGKQLTIYLHHNMLEYGHAYYVIIDKGIISGFEGIKGKKGWTFRTKDQAPDTNQRLLTVSADGNGDFSTVQGAMDFIPDSVATAQEGYRVFVKNGDYEELVYFRNKRFVTIEGESRDGVLIHYKNIPSYGWGKIDDGAKTANILEFNSHDADNRPIDTSKRNPLMRQLDPIRDAELIGRYSDSHWVLGF